MCSSVAPRSCACRARVHDLVVGHHVGAFFVEVGPERAEIALVDADVGRIDVRVDVVVAEIAVVPLAHQVGQSTERRTGRWLASSARPSSNVKRTPARTFSSISRSRVASVVMNGPSSSSVSRTADSSWNFSPN